MSNKGCLTKKSRSIYKNYSTITTVEEGEVEIEYDEEEEDIKIDHLEERLENSGEGKVQDSPYFKEMDAILGDKHKTEPVLVLESLKTGGPYSTQASSSAISNRQVQSANSGVDCNITPSPASSRAPNPLTNIENRFTNLKRSVKLSTPRNDALSELVVLQRQNQAARKDEFKAIMGMFMQQSQRQHEEMVALIATLPKKHKTNEDK
ncbi:hypothetical protein FQR65_LT16097 [Abscondita terminalis]|nr:hypothetical protein FQR65_LT16097 [Abscondita terminalis]